MLSLPSKITQRGVLAHLVERNTGSVEVSGSSPLYSTTKKRDLDWFAFFFVIYVP